tara:strand:- start:171 stop:758 length:588 start_codon:yes stop_codon:yes gene_type:complete
MFTVGLTGGVASGKTTATDFFAENGISVIDADKISRDLQTINGKGYQSIVEKFGEKILDSDGEINRAKIRELAFQDQEKRLWLEQLMHPMIAEEVLRQLEAVKSKWAIYSAPLWSEKNQFDRVLVIDVPINIQIERIKKRDNISDKLALEIINTQLTSHQRNEFATDLIINDGQIDDFKNKLSFYLKLYTNLANE